MKSEKFLETNAKKCNSNIFLAIWRKRFKNLGEPYDNIVHIVLTPADRSTLTYEETLIHDHEDAGLNSQISEQAYV